MSNIVCPLTALDERSQDYCDKTLQGDDFPTLSLVRALPSIFYQILSICQPSMHSRNGLHQESSRMFLPERIGLAWLPDELYIVASTGSKKKISGECMIIDRHSVYRPIAIWTPLLMQIMPSSSRPSFLSVRPLLNQHSASWGSHLSALS